MSNNKGRDMCMTSKLKRLAGPDDTEFWDHRVAWIADYRRKHNSTIRDAKDEWERLASVKFFHGQRPNR